MKRLIAALGMALLCGGLAQAAPNDKLELKSRVAAEEITVNAKGEKTVKLVAADKVVPGDVMVYTNTYRNTGSEAAAKVTIVNPVPRHTSYVEGSASGEGMEITFSVDGGKSFDVPGKLTLPGADGKPRPAKATEYTHIRWTLRGALAPNKSGDVSFRARIN